jgi:hypothetical protein
MNVTVICSDGTVLGEYEVEENVLRLRSGDEVTIWGRLGKKVRDDCAFIDALNSHRITVGSDKVARLDDGSPVTDEIMARWGWRKTDDGKWADP